MKKKREELCLTFLNSIHHEARSSQAQLYTQASHLTTPEVEVGR